MKNYPVCKELKYFGPHIGMVLIPQSMFKAKRLEKTCF